MKVLIIYTPEKEIISVKNADEITQITSNENNFLAIEQNDLDNVVTALNLTGFDLVVSFLNNQLL